MIKRKLIVCSDGTWNSPDDEDRGSRRPTNISKISRAILPVNDRDESQIVFYDEGVGTSWGQKFLGGITGLGLSANILECYRFLSDNYQDEDDIYLFGFSRGAFTSRSLSGFIAKVGIVTKADVYYLPDLYRLYREDASEAVVAAFCDKKSISRFKPRIKMLGVFDTVGALGIPLGGFNDVINDLNIADFQFHNIGLSPIVESAYHALAIDERRVPFKPSLWDEKAVSANTTMEQRWFSGVHSNIGGGYKPDGLANIALHYMVEKAIGCDLQFDMDYLAFFKAVPESELRNSMSFKYRILGEHVRPIDTASQLIDQSVRDRMAKLPNYKPPNVPPS